MKNRRRGFLVLSFICLSLFCYPFIWALAINTGDILISEIQTTGGPGKTNQDYIKLFNKTLDTLNLKGLRLIKRSKTGISDTSIKSWTSDTFVNPGAYYTWANNTDDFASSLPADISSSQTISDDNGLAIREGAENTGSIIDSLAWGDASNGLAENTNYINNPLANEQLTRQNNWDTNNNAQDFIIKNNNSTIITTTEPEIISNSSEPEIISDTNNFKITTPKITTPEIQETISTITTDTTSSSSSSTSIETKATAKTTKTEPNSEIYISEILPNPIGPDDQYQGEFIEIYNNSLIAIDLKNWLIKTDNQSFIFNKETKIEPKGYFTLYRQDSKILLNNEMQEIKLYEPNKKTVHQVIKYKKSEEGLSYNLSNYIKDGEWTWSRINTPNSLNIIKLNHEPIINITWPEEIIVGQSLIFDASDSFDSDNDELEFFWDFGDDTVSKQISPEHTYLTLPKKAITLTIKDSELTITKDKKYKNINKSNNEVKKNETKKETTIKSTKKATTTKKITTPKIKKLTYKDYVQKSKSKSAKILTSTDLNNIPEGELVTINAQLIEKKSYNLYFDDNQGEITVYLKQEAKISSKEFTVGDKMTITGIWMPTTSGFKLMPRSLSDIIKINTAQASDTLPKDQDLLNFERDKKTENLKMYLCCSGLIVILLIIFIYKKYKK